MPRPAPSIVFNELRRTTHHINESTPPTLFSAPDAPEFNDTEFWWYSDLHNLYGAEYTNIDYPYGDTHPQITQYAKKLKQNPVDLYNAHAIITYRTNLSDMKLSRFGAWATLKQHPALIFAQLYFIMPNATFPDLCDAAHKFARIHLRQNLSNAEKIISGITHRHGGNIANTHQTVRQTFFDNSIEYRQKNQFSPVPNTTWADHMSANALYTLTNALNTAIYKFDNATTRHTMQLFTHLLRDAISNARHTLIQNKNHAPEYELTPIPVSTVHSELKKQEREFIKQYSKQSLR